MFSLKPLSSMKKIFVTREGRGFTRKIAIEGGTPGVCRGEARLP